jgi:hypothetical protein
MNKMNRSGIFKVWALGVILMAGPVKLQKLNKEILPTLRPQL